MRDTRQLNKAAANLPSPLTDRGTVHLIVARVGDGQHQTPQRGVLDVDKGLVGDRWADGEEPNREQQVTLMNVHIAELVADGQPLHLPGDNFLVDLDLSEDALPVGTQLRVGTALLEITAKPHRGCKKFAERFGKDAMKWLNHKSRWSRRLRGVHAHVLQGGAVAVGDAVVVVKKGAEAASG